jgi:hypothetical protein
MPVVLATVWEGGMRKSYVARVHRTGIVALPSFRAPFRPSFFMLLTSFRDSATTVVE